MSDTFMDRHRRAGSLSQILIYWTLIGLCCAGHRASERGGRPRHTRHHDRWAQRIQYPPLHDQGTQQIVYPSLNDQGAEGVHYPSGHGRGDTFLHPSGNDRDTSSQIQKCAPGYYRDGSGPYLGRCVPCECNGLADECEDGTGRCLKCQYNTAGDRCERCKEGYYGIASQRTCRVCPCPFSTNSFAAGCADLYGDIHCVCKAGYTGDRCESCAPGYYGNPLTPGGSCRPCNCNGYGTSCDPKTGVCKNALEPGDTNTDDNCQECDNCAQTLLHDLEELDDDLERIKAQLDNATASASSQDRLKNLEKAVSDTKALVKNFSSAINAEKSRVSQAEDDTDVLRDDIDSLKDKADKQAADADKAVADAEKTHNKSKDLDADIKDLLKKIQNLLDKLKNNDGRGDVPNENLSDLLEKAQNMLEEMENRDFTPQNTAAENERDEAKKLLDHIKANVSKQSEKNEAAANKIRSLLKDYNAKLKELDKALKNASDLVKKANAQNGLNGQALGDLQKRVEDLKQEQKTVEDQMALAKNELKKTEDLSKKLKDSKTEYEQLAAQLDGAKTDLTKKVNDISKAAAKEDIVEKAEDHAKALQKQANELEDAVKNTSGRSEVRDAKDAIDAYKNIADAINAAEVAADEAKEAAENALNNVKKQNLTERAKDLKETSEDLLNDAQEAEENLNDAAKNIPVLNKRLTNAEKKKKALEKDLLDAQTQLNDIKRDDIGGMIDDAKRKAALANNTASNTMDRLNAIKKEINKINVTPVDSNLNSVLNDVDRSVKNLLTTIPSLNDKIVEVENLTSQFSPITNVSENIKKIKDLIEQARDAANRILIPVRFDGDGHVELRPPKNVEDLKAYTAMSLSLHRPPGRGDGNRRRRQTRKEEDMFVLYLGNRDPSKNYIGMVLRANVLHGVYKLNGKEYEMKTGFITRSGYEPAKFDRVDLRRIYQDAEMTLTKDITSNNPGVPIQQANQGDETKNLLDISPSDIVFYVGGYPANFTPPASLNFPMYKGCIEFSYVNNKVVSLYNFKRVENINKGLPCKRYVKPVDAECYEGTGFGKVLLDNTGSSLRIQMALRTHSENGLLFYIGSEKQPFTITMEKGFIVVYSPLLEDPVKSAKKIFPSSDWKDIQLIATATGRFIVTAPGSTISFQADFKLREFNEFYIGGLPQDLREKKNITTPPFKGCLKNFKLGGNFKPLDEQVGVSRGCPSDVLALRKAEFSLDSSLSSPLTGFTLDNDVTVSLGFKTTEGKSIILKDKQRANGIQLSLVDGYIVVGLDKKSFKSNKQYHDNQWHYLTVTRRSGRTEMIIDDEDKGQEQSGIAAIPDTGGSMILGNDDFKGCVSYLYTRRPDNLYKAEDLGLFDASGDVLRDACSAASPVQLMLDRNSKRR